MPSTWRRGKKNQGIKSKATKRRRVVLSALEEQLRMDKLFPKGGTIVTLSEGQKKRITKEINTLKERV